MATTRSIALFLVIVGCCHLAAAFNLERDLLSKFRSKRQIKKICSAELYDKPLNGICSLPPFMNFAAEVKACVAEQKVATLAASENICTFDCVHKKTKYVSTTGALMDAAKLTADLVAKSDATWKPVMPALVKECHKQAMTRAATTKLASGYVTKCKTPGFTFQTCMVVEAIKACPASKKSASFESAKAALSASCNPYMVFMTDAEIQAAAMKAVKGVDAKSASSALAAAAANQAQVQAMMKAKGVTLPAGANMAALMAKAQADPKSLSALMPKNFNPAMLGNILNGK